MLSTPKLSMNEVYMVSPVAAACRHTRVTAISITSFGGSKWWCYVN